ncbi:undecaprenyl-phosphate glucose phosphotransferase [Bordetella genomosp. 10]|uniref:Undecaprenyl-phosphate glucose phosphotransferase n=1 Tax=Bordetella genomosp. 10 TaxID=1416804 RepID=A0A261RYM4_9BORD|nr:undecaprenyl-phosphate glucose phosphotransferase [Bordetella genomosp. 10]OZI30198.1 undecaprenyl-phosphate glucose phosphotransferase [Bordetella genomosp. 10]
MALVGLVCALLNGGAFLILAGVHGIDSPVFLSWVPAILAASAFYVYSRFTLLISARNMWWMLGRGIMRWFNVLFLGVAALFFLPRAHTDPNWLRMLTLQWAAVALPLQVLGLFCLRRVAYRINNSPASRRSAVFFGMGPEARKLAMRLQRSPILGIYVAGYYADEPVAPCDGESSVPKYLGRYPDAISHIEAGEFGMAFVTLDDEKEKPMTAELMSRLYDSTSAIYLMPESPFLDELTATSADIAGVPLLALHETHMVGLSRSIKRAMDLVLGGAMIVLLSPVMLTAAIAIKLDSPGPVIFRQKRYGERGRPITVFKFRSMTASAGKEADGSLRQAQVGDRRVTRVGRFLRKTSLDELPQLFNVIMGTMSLVGPRPHAAEHNELYRRMIRGYMLRHSVKPGITGWAQIHGLRGETDTPEKMQRRVKYDRYYIANWSLQLDLKILARTVLVILWDRNAY